VCLANRGKMSCKLYVKLFLFLAVPNLLCRADFDTTIAKAGDKLVVVDFTAAWCGPCQRIKPRFAELADEFAHVIFAKVYTYSQAAGRKRQVGDIND
jgi:thiol-disulfide isomerase/thioredoxin